MADGYWMWSMEINSRQRSEFGSSRAVKELFTTATLPERVEPPVAPYATHAF